MPSTPNFNIPFPCSGDVVSADDIADWANGIDDALASIQTATTTAQTRPAMTAHQSGNGQSFAQNVAADFVFTTADFNRGVTATFPTASFTLPAGGLYRISAEANHTTTTTTTITRWQLILNAGAQRVSRNYNVGLAGGLFQIPIMVEGLFICVPGTIVTVNFLWTGTGGPTDVYGILYLNKISNL
jgi:hypothetical protein